MLESLEDTIQRHIAVLLVHKGMAPNVDEALKLFVSRVITSDPTPPIPSPRSIGKTSGGKRGEPSSSTALQHSDEVDRDGKEEAHDAEDILYIS